MRTAQMNAAVQNAKQVSTGLRNDSRVTNRSIDRFVTTLRKKIEANQARPHHIETIREFGNRFQA